MLKLFLWLSLLYSHVFIHVEASHVHSNNHNWNLWPWVSFCTNISSQIVFFWVRFWSVQSEKTFLTRLCEVRANTQFLGVLLVITLKFVWETIISKTSESYLGSCSSTISCQGHLTEHQGDIRQRNCLKKSIVCLCSSGSKLPTTCLIPRHVSKQRMHIGHNKLLISSSASLIFSIWTTLHVHASSASAITSVPRTEYENTPFMAAIFV